MASVVAVIVTYGNRFHLLEQVLSACVDEGVKELVIVDNNSSQESKKQLEAFQKESDTPIFICWNAVNEGSAKGYKQGLQIAVNQCQSDFVWLLDDDNRPARHSLKRLTSFWDQKPETVACLLSFRPDRVQYREAIFQDKPDLVLGCANSFNGFHVIEKWNKWFAEKPKRSENNFGEIAYSPFGGMFFEKHLIDLIGYPDETFFLYSDDHDWSYRITANHLKIYLLLNSVVEDIDTSWNVSQKGRTNVFEAILKASPFRVYYSIRNRMVFESRYLIRNKAVYWINRTLFTLILFLFGGFSKNFKVYLQAINDAKNNSLGQRNEYSSG